MQWTLSKDESDGCQRLRGGATSPTERQQLCERDDYESDDQSNHRRYSGVDHPGQHATNGPESVADLILDMMNPVVRSVPAEVVAAR